MRNIKSYKLEKLCNEHEIILLDIGDGVSFFVERVKNGASITVATGGEFVELAKGYSHLILNKDTESKIKKEYKTVKKWLSNINKTAKTR